MTLDVRVPADDAERGALLDILSVCFAASVENLGLAHERVGAEHLRVAVDGSRVVGGLWQLPMGQWFGGRSVPMTGLAAVGIDAGLRGTGAGEQLMHATLRELHERGVALSCLYPATVNFYRRAGYELAGSRFRIELPLKGLRVKPAAVESIEDARLGPADGSDFPSLERAYAVFAAAHAGLLDRGGYIWARVRQPRGESARHWRVEERGRLTGYLALTQKEIPGEPGHEIQLTDFVALTPGAVHALLAFLSGMRSMASRVLFFGSDRHPLLLALPDWNARVSLDLHWMLRLTDVRAALTARGWPAGAEADLALDVSDERLPGNAGPLRLAVAGGRAMVESGGPGRVRVTERGLAALYSGFSSPEALRRRGLLDGPPDDLARLATLFAGPSPWMPDMF